METSKVRKFWTSNPFYPELSGALVTFYTIVIFVCSGVFLIWISSPPPPPPTHTSSLLSFFLSVLLFYPLVEIQKKKKTSTSQIWREKKNLFSSSLGFFPLHYFFLLLLIISGHFFFLIMYCWNSFSGIHLKQLLGKPSSMGDVRFSTYINLKFYMLLRSGVGVCSSSEYFHIASS